MRTLKVPSSEFLIGAVRAGERAGFEGAIILLTRKLTEVQEREFQQLWEDIDDITHNDILVLTTGVKTKAYENIIVAYEMQRHVYADGIKIANNYATSFNNEFEDLIKYTSPLPESNDTSTNSRLIDPQGVTEIRRTLGINEVDLPALLIISYRKKDEFLIKLSQSIDNISPFDLIIEIVKNLNDIPFRFNRAKEESEKETERKKKGEFGPLDYFYHYNVQPALRAKNNIWEEHRRLNMTLDGRKAQLIANAEKIRRVLENSPNEIGRIGEELISFLENGSRNLKDMNSLIDTIISHLNQGGRTSQRFEQHLRNIVRHKTNQEFSDSKLSELSERHGQRLLELDEEYKKQFEEYKTRKEAEEKKFALLKTELPELQNRIETIFIEAVETTLKTCQFSLESTEDISSTNSWLREVHHNRSIYSKKKYSQVENVQSFDKIFDVFLSHNSKDKSMVRQLAQELKKRGIRVWLDEWELRPGQPWQEELESIIQKVRSAAILIGNDGLGPWEVPEMRSCLSEFVRRKMPVIPVLLPDSPKRPNLPLFLSEFTWVDLRQGMTSEILNKLCWGITGNKTDE